MPYADLDKAKANKRAYYLANMDRLKAAAKKYYGNRNPEEHKAKRRIYQLKYLAKRPDVRNKRTQEKRTWYQANKEHVRIWQRAYRSRRISTDPYYALEHKLRTKLSLFVKSCSTSLSCKKVALINCSRVELKKHIESLWKPGMSWLNYGVNGWHVDHKITCSKFDLIDELQREVCFHFSNLQTLWAQENLKKGAA